MVRASLISGSSFRKFLIVGGSCNRSMDGLISDWQLLCMARLMTSLDVDDRLLGVFCVLWIQSSLLPCQFHGSLGAHLSLGITAPAADRSFRSGKSLFLIAQYAGVFFSFPSSGAPADMSSEIIFRFVCLGPTPKCSSLANSAGPSENQISSISVWMNLDNRLIGFIKPLRLSLTLYFNSILIIGRLLVLAAYQMGGFSRNPFMFTSAPDLIKSSQFDRLPALRARINGVSLLPMLSCIGVLGDKPDVRSLLTFSVSPLAMALSNACSLL